MKVWCDSLLQPDRRMIEVPGDEIHIGRGADNNIVLNSPFVAERALVLHRQHGRWQAHALGANGCEIDSEPISAGQRVLLSHKSRIKVFPYSVTLEIDESSDVQGEPEGEALEARVSALIRDTHVELLSVMELDGDAARSESDEYLLSVERNIEVIVRNRHIDERLLNYLAGHAVRSRIVEQILQGAGTAATSPFEQERHWSRIVSATPERERDLQVLADRISQNLRVSDTPDVSQQMQQLENGFWATWASCNKQLLRDAATYLALCHVKKQIKDIVFGYGPLEDLLRTPTIAEIMVVSSSRIYIEKNGVVENSGRRFVSDEVTETIIERIVSRVGRRIDKSQPLVDARLSDGSRVNAVIPPLAVSGPSLTIRKFPLRRLAMDDLIARGALTPAVASFLRAAVVGRCNVLIAGGTGTGKTTLLNCLSDFIPNKERIVTIEDTAELQLSKEHVVRLETKQANVEGAGEYTIHDLVKNALRMRPERIIVGECRGDEALDMLQAMNTGHDGSLTTIHANSAEDVVLRLEVMVQSAANLPVDSIHRQISSAIDLVVQLTRMRDGSRKITQVTEVVGVDDERGGVRMKDLFLLETDEDGTEVLVPTGRLPSFVGKLVDQKLIDPETFYR